MPDELKVTDKEGKVFSITNIPAGLIDQVNARAASMYPGEESPWMHLVLDTFLSVTEADQSVFQMTGIPPDALAAFEARCVEVGYGDGQGIGGAYALFSVLLQASQVNMLEIGRLHTAESQPASSITLVITGIPEKGWEGMTVLASQMGAAPQAAAFFGDNPPSATGFIMGLIEQAHRHQLTFTANQAAKVTTRSNAKPVARQGKFVK